jgi:hypothetical protein
MRHRPNLCCALGTTTDVTLHRVSPCRTASPSRKTAVVFAGVTADVCQLSERPMSDPRLSNHHAGLSPSAQSVAFVRIPRILPRRQLAKRSAAVAFGRVRRAALMLRRPTSRDPCYPHPASRTLNNLAPWEKPAVFATETWPLGKPSPLAGFRGAKETGCKMGLSVWKSRIMYGTFLSRLRKLRLLSCVELQAARRS